MSLPTNTGFGLTRFEAATGLAPLPPIDGEGGRVAAGWGDHPLRLASLGTSPIEGEEKAPR